MSNGTDTLTFLDIKTFEPVRQIKVQMKDSPLPLLNELEYIDGKIYANIWKSSRIVIIDPADGLVAGWVNLKEFYKHSTTAAL
jgi:glutamine cyclotransferase